MICRHLAVLGICLLVACPAPPGDSSEFDTPDGVEIEADSALETAFDTAEVDPDIEVTFPECTPGEPAACDDNNPCTDDLCRASATCAHTPNSARCDDGDGCTASDRCSGGLCVGSALDCDDGLPCTRDVCIDGACAYVPDDGPCDDGDLCTEGETCVDGECVGAAVVCPESPCGKSLCAPQTGCAVVPLADGQACDDGDACTRDTTCNGGACRGALVTCDDGDVCTDDYCDSASGCVARPNRAPCDDGDACTQGDRCAEGRCAGSGECCVDAAACDDGDPCTDDACLGACIHTPVRCDDGDACTRDVCELGACVSTRWTAADADRTVDDFEAGVGAWVISSTNATVTWRVATSWAASGEASLYCGDEAGDGYDFGATRASALTQILVPPGAPELIMAVRSDVASGSCVYDAVAVVVDGDVLDVVCGSGERELRLSLVAYEGREVTLELVFDTIDEVDNSGAGVWVDLIRISAQGCEPAEQ